MSYRSHADLGGTDVRGRILPEPEADPFQAPWEAQAHALTIAMGATGSWNLDMSRSARETLPDYDSLTYYEKWLAGLERLLLERGLVTAQELAQGRMLTPPRSVSRVLKAAEVPAALAKGAPTERPVVRPARFTIGELVRARAGAIEHHTRLPAYARGKLGRIEANRGVHVFADTHAQGLGEQPQWLYTVVFSGRELRGEAAAAGSSVSIDAFEPYLEAGT